jgi:hypothetical protein
MDECGAGPITNGATVSSAPEFAALRCQPEGLRARLEEALADKASLRDEVMGSLLRGRAGAQRDIVCSL